MDLNADEHNDILSGSYSRTDGPMAGLFQVLWGNPDGTFKKAAALKGIGDEPLVIPNKGEDDLITSICTRPFAVDWDWDGDLDLVVGNFAGTFFLFTAEAPGKYKPAPEVIKSGDKPLSLKGHHGDPFLIDWDNDGDIDLLSGSALGGVQIAENTASARAVPRFGPFVDLISPRAEERLECRPSEYVTPGGSTRVWVADMNADGKLDILVGDSINLIAPAENVSEADFARRYAEWNSEYKILTREAGAATDDSEREKCQEKISAHYEKRSEFIVDHRTGSVWVYLQK